jgi:inner membrane protein
MRWLMPFVNRWYYGDALFIVDPWIWAALILGVVLARRMHQRYATYALLIVGVYMALMLGASQLERRLIAREVPGRVMVSPVPLNPFRRTVVIDAGDRYRFGTIDWLRRPVFSLETREIPKDSEREESRRAAQTPEGQTFLKWARFPYFIVGPLGDVVHIEDARYRPRPAGSGFGVVVIRF